MAIFQIEDYTVSMKISRSKSPGEKPATTHFERVLELRGKKQAHGIRTKVLLAFSSSFSAFNEPVVGNWSGKFDDAIVGFMHLSEFQYYYDVLRSEKPVFFRYQFKEGASGHITSIGITTSTEPLGEGLADTSALVLDFDFAS